MCTSSLDIRRKKFGSTTHFESTWKSERAIAIECATLSRWNPLDEIRVYRRIDFMSLNVKLRHLRNQLKEAGRPTKFNLKCRFASREMREENWLLTTNLELKVRAHTSEICLKKSERTGNFIWLRMGCPLEAIGKHRAHWVSRFKRETLSSQRHATSWSSSARLSARNLREETRLLTNKSWTERASSSFGDPLKKSERTHPCDWVCNFSVWYPFEEIRMHNAHWFSWAWTWKLRPPRDLLKAIQTHYQTDFKCHFDLNRSREETWTFTSESGTESTSSSAIELTMEIRAHKQLPSNVQLLLPAIGDQDAQRTLTLMSSNTLRDLDFKGHVTLPVVFKGHPKGSLACGFQRSPEYILDNSCDNLHRVKKQAYDTDSQPNLRTTHIGLHELNVKLGVLASKVTWLGYLACGLQKSPEQVLGDSCDNLHRLKKQVSGTASQPNLNFKCHFAMKRSAWGNPNL